VYKFTRKKMGGKLRRFRAHTVSMVEVRVIHRHRAYDVTVQSQSHLQILSFPPLHVVSLALFSALWVIIIKREEKERKKKRIT
jgi:hypothetical protein